MHVVIRVKAGVFSMTPPAPADDDGSYLRWHLLDHMPEQYQLPGIVHAQRWVADGEYLNRRLASHGALGDVANVMNYLMGDPVQRTLDDFIELGGAAARDRQVPRLVAVGPGGRPGAAPLVCVTACADLTGGRPVPPPSRRRADRGGTDRRPARRLAAMAPPRAPPGAARAPGDRRCLGVRLDRLLGDHLTDLAHGPAVRDGRLPRRGAAGDDEGTRARDRGAVGVGCRAAGVRRPAADHGPVGGMDLTATWRRRGGGVAGG